MVEQRDIDIIMNNPIDWEMFRNKTIMVTGATGRLGMYFVEAILKADIDYNLNLKVIALARDQEKLKKVFGESLDLTNLYTLVQDIVDSVEWEGDIDYIFHTAGPAAPVDFTNAPVDTLKAHLKGTMNILDLTVKKHTKRVVYISTIEIYGENTSDKDFAENDMGIIYCNQARACYPEAKRMCETMLASYAAQYGVEFIGIRMSHTLGPGIPLTDGRAFAEFLRCALNSENIVLHSDGSAMRPYTYTADAIGAILIATTKGEANSFYNIANNDNMISIRDLAELISSLDPNGKSKVQFDQDDKGKLRYLPFKLGVMNTERIKKLGWRPSVNIREVFRYTMEWLIQQGIL